MHFLKNKKHSFIYLFNKYLLSDNEKAATLSSWSLHSEGKTDRKQ